MQGLDVTSGELVDGARKECENPLTLRSFKTITTIRIIFFKNKSTCTISNMSSMSHRPSTQVGERTLHIYHFGRLPKFSAT
jgi:hypothetical protein